ncbi:MAG: YsnF/AvaK domain-containing protein [Hymenobacteraceae bacterium]|nr:YsnF/AvaK domain-containing protein [Hymenobacteraceae bacterium]MDX5394570.1 YsnF/AvaK domain-containing protein [Hymenobacteraceae bacterium]MDX5510591.1 YsnF/AvaK domain-containing protein [Hymenobacteraceae bacterium]
MTQTVVALFEDKSDAQRAVQQLTRDGFTGHDIDVSEACEPGKLEKQKNVGDEDSISRFFNSLFGNDDHEARRYSEAAHHCDTIVTVHAKSEDQAKKAATVLDSFGAEDVDTLLEQARTGQPARPQTPPPATGNVQDTGKTASIPVIKEEMNVGKKVVETGGVRVKSRIVERPVEEKVRLREEHVRVERNKVNRPATEADLKNFQQGEKEIVERAEVPVVGKEARVVEEVRIGKEEKEHTETIEGKVKHTEVDVDKINNPNTPGNPNNPNTGKTPPPNPNR